MVNRHWNNIELTVPSASTNITFNKGTGTDTATEKFFELPLNSTIRSVIIDPDKNVVLISIDGVEAKNGKTIRGDKGFTRPANAILHPWGKFVIKTTEATTKVAVAVFTI